MFTTGISVTPTMTLVISFLNHTGLERLDLEYGHSGDDNPSKLPFIARPILSIMWRQGTPGPAFLKAEGSGKFVWDGREPTGIVAAVASSLDSQRTQKYVRGCEGDRQKTRRARQVDSLVPLLVGTT